MGGNTFQATRRISRDEFQRIGDELSPFLEKHTNDYHFLNPYKNKKDFGDIDIIINSKESFNKSFNSYFIYPSKRSSKNTISILYENQYQVDFMLFQEHFNTAVQFYRHGDLGNILGRIANRLSTKFGFKGLFYKYDCRYHVYDIFLTDDINKILPFLGFIDTNDIQKYNSRFESQEDIFKFVTKSKFFHPDYFKYSELNNQNRTRNKKRKMYSAFVEFCDTLNYNKEEHHLFKPKKEYFEYVLEWFPHLKDEIEKIEEKLERTRNVSEKFNGKMIMELIGLQGKELGEFIKKFRLLYTPSNSTFSDFILRKSKDEIKNLILSMHQSNLII